MPQYCRKPITKLCVGDYVARVTKQLGDVHITQAGQIKSEKFLQELKRKGVLEVEVDVLQSQQNEKTVKPSQSKKPRHNSDDIKHWYDLTIELLTQTQLRAAQSLPVDLYKFEQVSRALFEFCEIDLHQLAAFIRSNHTSNQWLCHSLRVAISLAQFCVAKPINKTISQHVIEAGFLAHLGLEVCQREQTKQHLQCLFNLLKLSGEPKKEVMALLYHQAEHLDGSGEPQHLTAQQLTIYDRLLAIALKFDCAAYGYYCVQQKWYTPEAAYHMLIAQPHLIDPQLLQHFINVIGLYPAGSLVKLHSGRLAVVKTPLASDPLKPLVRVFYNGTFHHHVKPFNLDLMESEDFIDCAVLPSEFDITIENIVSY